ncbi:Oligopeptide transporter 1 [Acorus calamus]|uniref:Oligopeptide transporter 1 n=1 Tax=Acorus calamus TaxID=4465 RepID=A0AAV9D976_ACOCL|nr:Oligopeptide transporter 1 [Acorus calamus]
MDRWEVLNKKMDRWEGMKKTITETLEGAMHEKENRIKGSLTSFQFFLIATISSFAYYIVPNYLFPSISALSFICWIWRDSITAQIIGSGRNGLGIGSFSLDWTVISGYLGNPLVMPFFTLDNL